MNDGINIFAPEDNDPMSLPLSDSRVAAGFPSPAEDYASMRLDLNRELIKNPASTFYARVSGLSMVEEGINDGDLVVIDKSLEVKDGDFVVAFIDGEFTLKEFRRDEENNCAWLIPHNKQFEPIKVTEENDFMIWGVLTYTIKQLRK